MKVNKIYHMDCIEGMSKLAPGSIDLIVADPPYKFKDGGGKGFVAKLQKKQFLEIEENFGHNFNPAPVLEASLRVMKIYNAYWWTSKDLLPQYLNFAVDHKFSFNFLMLHKLNPMPLVNNDRLPDTEYCVFMREKGAYFNSDLRPFSKFTKYFFVTRGQRNNGHPTPKPLEPIQYSVHISSKKGSLVLDPFMGSGTTAVACRQFGRNFIGFERIKKYCNLSEDRLKQEVLSL